MNFLVQSRLPLEYRASLERLLFFNERQSCAYREIVESIEAYGCPQLHAEDGCVTVALSGQADVQCLFALTADDVRTLAGVMIFARPHPSELVVVHVAVADEFARPQREAVRVLLALARAVREAAHRIRGIEVVRLAYRGGSFTIDDRNARSPLIAV